MATYTGVADANGDFTVHFSSNYTGGQKITVTAEKDAATKTIELHAPSEVIAPPSTDFGIQFSGTMVNFPTDIGVLTIVGATGNIPNYAMGCVLQSGSTYYGIGSFATGLALSEGITRVGAGSFQNWTKITTLSLPTTLTQYIRSAFANCSAVQKLTIPKNAAYFEDYVFYNWVTCTEITVLATTPPGITDLTFNGLNNSCIFKVPAASVTAYKSAAGWSAFASRIQAI